MLLYTPINPHWVSLESDLDIKGWLCPSKRKQVWRVITRDHNIEKWFKENGRGTMCFFVYPYTGLLFEFEPRVTVGFSDTKTAIMFKLIFGGR